jgi:hypothetical protein
VRSLLDQPESAARFLSTPAADLGARLGAPSSMARGRRIGAYEVQGLLGIGGMGEVYRARDTRLGRDVAIKILPRAVRDDPGRVARFAREAQVLATLNHPHIGAIYLLEGRWPERSGDGARRGRRSCSALGAQSDPLLQRTPDAVRWLRVAVTRGFVNYPFLAGRDPFLESVREDAAFQALMAEVRERWESF